MPIPSIPFRPVHLAGVALVGLLLLGPRARADEQWFPLVPAEEGRRTVVTVVNPTSRVTDIQVFGASDDGAPFLVGGEAQLSGVYGPGESRRAELVAAAAGPDAPVGGALRAFADSEVLAWMEGEHDGHRVAARARSSIRGRHSLVLPGLIHATDGSATTSVRVVNVSDAPADVDVTVRNSAGSILGTFSTTELQPGFSVGFTGGDLGVDGAGILFVSGTERVLAAMEVQTADGGADLVTSGSDAVEDGQFWFPLWSGENFETGVVVADVFGGSGFSALGLPFDARGGTVGSAAALTVTSGKVVERTLETLTGGEFPRGVGALRIEITNGSAPRAPFLRVTRTDGDFAVLDPMRRIRAGRSGFVPLPADDAAAIAEEILVVHAPDDQDAVGYVRLRDAAGRVLLRKRVVVRSMRTVALPLRRLIGRRGRTAQVIEIVNPPVGEGKAPLRARRVVGGGAMQAALLMSSERIVSRRPRGTGDLLAGYPAVQSSEDLAPAVVAPAFLRPEHDRRGVLTLDALGANVGRRAALRIFDGETELGTFRVRVPGRGSIRLRVTARSRETRTRLYELWPVGQVRGVVIVDETTLQESAATVILRAEPPEVPAAR